MTERLKKAYEDYGKAMIDLEVVQANINRLKKEIVQLLNTKPVVPNKPQEGDKNL